MEVIEKIFSLVGVKYKNDKEFAKAIKVDPSRVSEWRKGKSKSYMKRLDVIAKALDVTVGELHGETSSDKVALQDVSAMRLDPNKTMLLIEPKPDGTLLTTPIVQELSARDARLIAWFRSLSPEKQKAILISQDAPKDVE